MSGIFVTGTSRSGTSMTAGLFREHGVFFGDTHGPHPANRKGNLENKWLKNVARTRNIPSNWPDPWFRALEDQGWDGELPWGAKLGAESWFFMKNAGPSVVVICWRPVPDVVASRERAPGWGRRGKGPVLAARERMEALQDDASVPVIDVETPKLARGDYSEITPAFDVLGIEFSEEIAEEWIEPHWFHV